MRAEAYIGSYPARPVFPFEGKWYTFDGKLVSGGTAYPTQAATAMTLKTERLRFMFKPPDIMDEKTVPTTEAEALLGTWELVEVWEIDAASGTFKGNDSEQHPIAATRVGDGPRAKNMSP